MAAIPAKPGTGTFAFANSEQATQVALPHVANRIDLTLICRQSFLYFDLGNVLLYFDHRLACQQMGAVAGVSAETVWEVVFASDSGIALRSRRVRRPRVLRNLLPRNRFAARFRRRCCWPGSEIFYSQHARFCPWSPPCTPPDIGWEFLSNTCPAHWAYCRAAAMGCWTSAFQRVTR